MAALTGSKDHWNSKFGVGIENFQKIFKLDSAPGTVLSNFLGQLRLKTRG